MNKLLLPLLCLCLVAWLFGGAVWFGDQYAPESEETGWLVQDGSKTFQSPTNFAFQLSDAEIILDDHQQLVIDQIATYLTDNPGRNLQITGLYSKNELSNGDQGDLGQLRAESFKYLLYRLGVPIDRIEVQSNKIEQHKLNANGLIEGGVDFKFFESPYAKYHKAFAPSKQVFFDRDSVSAITNEDFDDYFMALHQYMVDNPEQTIELNGYSRTVDLNSKTRERVYHIETLLRNKGIEAERIRTSLATFPEEAIQLAENSYVEINVR